MEKVYIITESTFHCELLAFNGSEITLNGVPPSIPESSAKGLHPGAYQGGHSPSVQCRIYSPLPPFRVCARCTNLFLLHVGQFKKPIQIFLHTLTSFLSRFYYERGNHYVFYSLHGGHRTLQITLY